MKPCLNLDGHGAFASRLDGFADIKIILITLPAILASTAKQSSLKRPS